MYRVQEWQLSLSYFLSYFPLIVSGAILCPLHNLKTVRYYKMILKRYVEQILTMCHVQEWQLSLSYFLSYFRLIVSDAISCPRHNLKNLWYYITILHSYVEHILMLCRVHSFFLSYFRLIVSNAISCPLHNLKTLWYYIMILHSYVEHILIMCRVQEWQLSLTYFLKYFPLMVRM